MDLIVTARRGLGSLGALIGGSVSRYLMRLAHRPALVVPFHSPRSPQHRDFRQMLSAGEAD